MNPNNDEKANVSIGLPVYNGGKFIRKRLESILSQTYTNFELTISDNASTDSTSEICKEFEKKDDRIKYIRQKKKYASTLEF
jgi:glycosyltransferase involved in cell wall biosynthesis